MPDDPRTNHQLADEAERIARAWFQPGSRERRLMIAIAVRLRDDAVEDARLRVLECKERLAART